MDWEKYQQEALKILAYIERDDAVALKELKKLLKTYEADKNKILNSKAKGKFLLAHCVDNNNTDAATLLLVNGASVEVFTEEVIKSNTCLQHAMARCHISQNQDLTFQNPCLELSSNLSLVTSVVEGTHKSVLYQIQDRNILIYALLNGKLCAGPHFNEIHYREKGQTLEEDEQQATFELLINLLSQDCLKYQGKLDTIKQLTAEEFGIGEGTKRLDDKTTSHGVLIAALFIQKEQLKKQQEEIDSLKSQLGISVEKGSESEEEMDISQPPSPPILRFSPEQSASNLLNSTRVNSAREEEKEQKAAHPSMSCP